MPRYSAEPISRYTPGILRYHGDKNEMRCPVVVYLLFCYFYREREREAPLTVEWLRST